MRLEPDEALSLSRYLRQGPPDSNVGAEPSEIRMRVSSRHLILVSSVFERLLKGAFAESHSLRSTGTLEIRLPEDAPKAFEIILNIIHGHTKKVPRKVAIELLTQICVLVDKYRFDEVAMIFTDMWFENLRRSSPVSFTMRLLSWICVSWVLRKEEMFKRVTKLAVSESDDHLDSDLPIPGSIFGWYIPTSKPRPELTKL